MDSRAEGSRRAAAILVVLLLAGLAALGLGTDARGERRAAPLAADESAAVAFDGTNFFVVWTDYDSGNGDVHGARVTQAGTVLDQGPGIPIAAAPAQQGIPAVAFDGTNYLVVWQDRRTNDIYDIYGARVTPAGDVLDPDGIPITTAAGDQTATDVAFDGTNFLVTWTDSSPGNGTDVMGARVTTTGTILDPNGIPISTTPGGHGSSLAHGHCNTWSGDGTRPAGCSMNTGGGISRQPSF